MNERTGPPGWNMAAMMGTVATVRQALTTLDPNAGAAAIVQVRDALAHVPGTDEVSTTLAAVHAELTGGAPDGAQLGVLLRTVATETRVVARRAGLVVGSGLALLADRLTAVANEIGPAV